MSSPFASIVSRTREQINLGESGVRGLAQSLGIIVVAGVLLVGFALTASAFFTVGNIRNIFVQTTVLAVAAIGETIVMLTGGIDLSVGAIAFLGEVLVADLTTPLAAGATGVGLGAPPGGHSVLFALLVAFGRVRRDGDF